MVPSLLLAEFHLVREPFRRGEVLGSLKFQGDIRWVVAVKLHLLAGEGVLQEVRGGVIRTLAACHQQVEPLPHVGLPLVAVLVQPPASRCDDRSPVLSEGVTESELHQCSAVSLRDLHPPGRRQAMKRLFQRVGGQTDLPGERGVSGGCKRRTRLQPGIDQLLPCAEARVDKQLSGDLHLLRLRGCRGGVPAGRFQQGQGTEHGGTGQAGELLQRLWRLCLWEKHEHGDQLGRHRQAAFQ